MDSRLKKLLDDNNLELVYLPLEYPGYLGRRKGNEPDIIFVNESLSESEVKEVIYHEIGHKLYDEDIPGSYKDDYLSHVRSEDLAEVFKAKMMVKDYANMGYEISTVNYVDLAHAIGTQDYKRIKHELAKYK